MKVVYLAAFGVFVAIIIVAGVLAMRRLQTEVDRHHQALEEERADGGDTDPRTESDHDADPDSA